MNMSWSVSFEGPSDEVSKNAAEELGRYDLPDLEKPVCMAALALIQAAMAAQVNVETVKVTARGSQSCYDWDEGGKPLVTANSVSVTVEPVI
jgi:predicted hydrocarbon binding protein